MNRLGELSRSVPDCTEDELWRGQLHTELRALEHVGKLLADLEEGLDRLVAGDERIQRLKTVPGVGNRLAEMVVTTLDCPERFKSCRQVGAYAGLVPRQFESGTMSRAGRITKQGPGLLRRLLVQIAWGMERRSPRVKALFDRISGGQKSGRKKAAVAIARKILIWCWAMLRDGTTWSEVELTAS